MFRNLEIDLCCKALNPAVEHVELFVKWIFGYVFSSTERSVREGDHSTPCAFIARSREALSVSCLK